MACRFDAGEKPNFLSETKNVREGNWKVTAITTWLCTVPLLAWPAQSSARLCSARKMYTIDLESSVLFVQVAPLPKDLQDRRVEITGPVDRKMVINAMNCGASVFMADFEDSNAPTW